MSAYVYDPSRRILSVPSSRLNRMLVRDAHRHASLAEYSRGSGLSVDAVLAQLDPYLNEGALALEVVHGEIFVLTAPGGRPIPHHIADIAPNLWETFRRRTGLTHAHQLWALTRSLERAGWAVEVVPTRIAYGLGHLQNPPYLGVGIQGAMVPLLDFPAPNQLTDVTGLLGEYERAGAAAVALTCGERKLDTYVTAARQWMVRRTHSPTAMGVVILEAPRYQPVLLSSADSALTPISISRPAASQ